MVWRGSLEPIGSVIVMDWTRYNFSLLVFTSDQGSPTIGSLLYSYLFIFATFIVALKDHVLQFPLGDQNSALILNRNAHMHFDVTTFSHQVPDPS